MRVAKEKILPATAHTVTSRRSTLAGLAGLTLFPACLDRTNSDVTVGGRSGLESWLEARTETSAPVEIPASPIPLRLSGAVRVPSGMNLVVRRDLIGSSGAHLILSGNSSVRFEGARSTNVYLKIIGGMISVWGFKYSGFLNTAAILIPGPGPYRDLLIEDLEVSEANYGVLRQGGSSALFGATIRRGRFVGLRGDAIEWNNCPQDVDVLVEDHEIDGIDDPYGRPNWGIGIGFAGGAFDPSWRPAQLVKRFAIRNIRGRALRQLIHVEKATDFQISHVVGQHIVTRYSARSGMPSAVIACYGCSDFGIRSVRSDTGDILLFAGSRRQRYVVPSANFLVHDVELARGDLRTQMGGPEASVRISMILLKRGSIILRGEVRRLTLSDIDVTSADAEQEPIRFDPDFLSGPLAGFRPRSSDVRRTNLRLRRGV